MKTRIWATMSEARAAKLDQRHAELTKQWFELQSERDDLRAKIRGATRALARASRRMKRIEWDRNNDTESIWIECRLEPVSDTEYKIVRTDTGETVGTRPRSAAELAREAREIELAAKRARQTRLFE